MNQAMDIAAWTGWKVFPVLIDGEWMMTSDGNSKITVEQLDSLFSEPGYQMTEWDFSAGSVHGSPSSPDTVAFTYLENSGGLVVEAQEGEEVACVHLNHKQLAVLKQWISNLKTSGET